MQDWPALHYWRTEQLSPFSNQGEMGAFRQNATARRCAHQWTTKPFILALRSTHSWANPAKHVGQIKNLFFSSGLRE
jgi:hypothetical protein